MWQVKAVIGVVMLGALVATDFVTGNNARPEGEKQTFVAYVQEWTSLAAAALPARPAADDRLVAALPSAPTGWKRNPSATEDVAAMLVPEAQAVISGGGGEPGKDVRRLAAVGGPHKEAGLQAVAFTYAYGRNRVVVEVLRHPDAVMRDPAQVPEKMRLQAWLIDDGAEKIGEVMGMPVWQARIVPGLGAKMAIAGIGGQVQLRAVYPERMKTADVLDLLQGLDVDALNRSVVEPDMAITAAVAAAAAASAAKQSAGILGAVTGMLFGTPAPETEADRKAREKALVAAAKSGDAATAGVLAAAEYGAIAEELGKTEMKAAPSSRSGLTGARGGRTTEITVGIGACGDRGGGKFCSVSGPTKD